MATKPALMNLPIETSDAGFYSGFSKDVTISAKILVSALIIWAVVFPENASKVLSALNSFLLSNFASWYIFVVAFYVVVCLLFALVPSSGKLLLGRPGAGVFLLTAQLAPHHSIRSCAFIRQKSFGTGWQHY